MEFLKLKSRRLHNEEHFQFHTEFKELVVQKTTATLGIETQYPGYALSFANETEAIAFIRKNSNSDEIVVADDKRDFTFRGVDNTVKACGNHFDLLTRQAAARIEVVFDHYGNLTVKPYDEETAAINNLISELNDNHAADVTTLGIGGWLNELKANNEAFDALMKGRYSKEAVKTQLRMKQVRLEVDAAYKQITNRINALIIVNGETAYKGFVDEMNQRILKYNNNVLIRLGRNAKVKPAVAQ
jgi:hypothetical protein